MTTTTQTNQPVQVRDGTLKAVIWTNLTADGERTRYSAEFTRSYRDDQGNWHDTRSFSGAELLRIARLAEQAYSKIIELKAEAKQDAEVDQ